MVTIPISKMAFFFYPQSHEQSVTMTPRRRYKDEARTMRRELTPANPAQLRQSLYSVPSYVAIIASTYEPSSLNRERVVADMKPGPAAMLKLTLASLGGKGLPLEMYVQISRPSIYRGTDAKG